MEHNRIKGFKKKGNNNRNNEGGIGTKKVTLGKKDYIGTEFEQNRMNKRTGTRWEQRR